MDKTLLVLRNEIYITVRRRSFFIIALGVPVLSFIILGLVGYINRSSPQVIETVVSAPSRPTTEGYVDQAGLVVSLPDSVPEESLLSFPDEEAARTALATGEIGGFYIIPANYLSTGRIINIRPEFNSLDAFGESNLMSWILQVNLLAGDEAMAARINRPMILEVTSLSPEPQRDTENPATFFIPYAVTMIFYIIILTSSSYLLNSVTKEKENRLMEILMVSIKPRQLLTGKFFGLGIVGLFQTTLWILTGFIILRISGRTFQLPPGSQLSRDILVLGLIYFLLGYALYGSLLAGVGALVPNIREASQATFIVILPMIIPLILVSVLIEDPGGTLAVVLSIFPFTAPVTMMTRLAADSVPPAQVILSLGLTALTAYVIFRGVVRLFQAQILMTGQPFSTLRYFSALLGRI